MPLHVKKHIVGLLQVNCYLIWPEGSREAAVIDPGGGGRKILDSLLEKNLELRYIVHTHGHWDHTGAAPFLYRKTSAPSYMHPADHDPKSLLSRLFRKNHPSLLPLADGQTLPLGPLSLKVIHTPGHSPGSVCLLIADCLFSGDLLFAGGVGRFDLKGGSFRELVKSLRERLAPLPDRLQVYPGHGPDTILGQERAANALFRAKGSAASGRAS
jgi:glyoxylase-like metal-dependent hydrolase (beta-lactamase superfamily II)